MYARRSDPLQTMPRVTNANLCREISLSSLRGLVPAMCPPRVSTPNQRLLNIYQGRLEILCRVRKFFMHHFFLDLTQAFARPPPFKGCLCTNLDINCGGRATPLFYLNLVLQHELAFPFDSYPPVQMFSLTRSSYESRIRRGEAIWRPQALRWFYCRGEWLGCNYPLWASRWNVRLALPRHLLYPISILEQCRVYL